MVETNEVYITLRQTSFNKILIIYFETDSPDFYFFVNYRSRIFLHDIFQLQ